MYQEKIISAFAPLKNFVKRYFKELFVFTAILIAAITTIRLQNRIVGWEPGYDDLQPKHHGWVSSHTLAIISHASLENNFVGYALAFKEYQNHVDYQYFDRYPIFFSALFHQALSLVKNLSAKIYAAKQVMNLIYLSTMMAAFFLIDKLISHKLLSLTIVLLAFSNPFLLYYKDMVHFDQPALFGIFILMLTIAFYKLDGLRAPLYAATLLTVGLGRGYASYAVMILWLTIESILILKASNTSVAQKIRNIIQHDSFLILIIGIVWGAGLLSYNVFIEAHKRQVPISQTSILNSAEKRLSLDDQFNQENAHIINWSSFTKEQVNRIVKWSFPIHDVNFGSKRNGLLLGFMFLAMFFFIRKQKPEKRIIYLLMILSGFVWLIPLRNLSAFHDYTTMYYIGIPLVFFLSVFTFLNPSKETTYYILAGSLIVYVVAIGQVKELHEERAGKASQYTYDFMRILDEMDGEGKNIFMKGNVPYAPFAPGFYLSDHYLSSLELADYVIARDSEYLPNTLTPTNDKIFLFKP